MITYQELCNRYRVNRTKASDNRQKLMVEIAEFVKAVSDSLGLAGKSWDSGDRHHPYVFLVPPTGEKMKRLLPNELEFVFDGVVPSCDISVFLTIEEGENKYPKQNLGVPIKFTLNNDHMLMEFYSESMNTSTKVILNGDPKRYDDAVNIFTKGIYEAL